MLDAAYFARVDAIQFTIAHDDGVGEENWEEADIVLVGVSRSSKTPTSIYLANRGYKTVNVPVVVESPPPPRLFTLKHPLIVGLTTSADRLIQIRRNRLLSLNQQPGTAYVDLDAVAREVAFARRMFADQGWPGDRRHAPVDRGDRGGDHPAVQRAQSRARRVRLVLASQSASRRAMLAAAGVPHAAIAAPIDEDAAKAALLAQHVAPRDLADALAELKALRISSREPAALVLGCDSVVALDDGTILDKPDTRETAARHLRLLSGKRHDLISAAVIALGGRPVWRHVDVARMHVRPLSDAFIDAYLDVEWPAISGCVGCYRVEGPGIQLFARDPGRSLHHPGPAAAAAARLSAHARGSGVMTAGILPYAEVIGDPISHSKSPLIHNFWLRALGIDGDYRAVHVLPAELEAYFASRRADAAWRGCNVTIPHKQAALAFVEDAGACANRSARSTR